MAAFVACQRVEETVDGDGSLPFPVSAVAFANGDTIGDASSSGDVDVARAA